MWFYKKNLVCFCVFKSIFFPLSISCLLMAIVTGIAFQNLLKSSWKQQLRLKKNWLYQVNLGFPNWFEIKKRNPRFPSEWGSWFYLYKAPPSPTPVWCFWNAETCHFGDKLLIHLCPWHSLCSVGRSLWCGYFLSLILSTTLVS